MIWTLVIKRRFLHRFPIMKKKNYSAIEAMFVSAGFTNVRCIALNDLTMGVLKKPGMVDSITINGREVTSGGKKYPKDAAVVISYHSLSR